MAGDFMRKTKRNHFKKISHLTRRKKKELKMSPVQSKLDFPTRKLRSRTVKKLNDEELSRSSSRKTPIPKDSSSPKKVSEKIISKKSPTNSPRKVLGSSNSPVKKIPSNLFPEDFKSLNLSSKENTPIKLKEENPKNEKKCISLFKTDVNRLREAKKALSLSAPKDLIGRDKQINQLDTFLSSSKKSLYVSGAPGTGKTASLKFLLNSKYEKEFCSIVFINCMSLRSSSSVFGVVARELTGDTTLSLKEREAKDFVENYVRKDKKILLVLDEIDQLDTKSQDVLYTIFEWPFLAGSGLILIGIANSLDLTDRVLPRLKLRKTICPEQLSFPAYTKSQIEEILIARLDEAGNNSIEDNPLIKPGAIKFLAGKISALSGDVRKALDVCRRALELSELSAKKQILLSPGPCKVKPVDLPQILKIVNEVYGSRVGTSLAQADNDLPLVQKLLIASLLLMTRGGRNKETSFIKLHATYSKVCKKRNMAPISESEAVSMIALLDSRGLVALRGSKKEPRYSKVSLRIDENEVEIALKDKTLLSDILKDESCISK